VGRWIEIKPIIYNGVDKNGYTIIFYKRLSKKMISLISKLKRPLEKA